MGRKFVAGEGDPAGAGAGIEPLDMSGAVATPIETWQDAERLGLALVLALGSSAARLTGEGGDSGLDITADTMVAQVKHWVAPVGRPEVQKLAGAATGRTAVFLAPMFTRQARDWADDAGVALFTYTDAAVVRPLNVAAGRLMPAGGIGVSDVADRDFGLRAERAERWYRLIEAELNRRLRDHRPATRRQRKDLARDVNARDRLRKASVSLAKMGEARRSKVGRQFRVAVRVGDVERELKAVAKLVGLVLPE